MRIIFFIITALVLTISTSAQWEKVADFNVGSTGKVMMHNNKIYVYGDNGDYLLYRTSDNGNTWEEISSKLPEELMDMCSFNGKLFGLYLQTIYVSNDDGDSWTPVQTVNVTGNGALRSFNQDGSTLYISSNRKSYYKSTDGGNNFTEYIFESDQNLQMVAFSAHGNNMLAVFAGAGFFSTDGGTNWTQLTADYPLTEGYNFNGDYFSASFGKGIYKLDLQSNTWAATNSGVVDDGGFVIVKSINGVGGSLFFAFTQLISNKASVYISNDNGASWSEVNPTGLPGSNATGSTGFIAANSSYLFNFYYGLFDPENTGIYRTAISVSDVKKEDKTIPNKFNLSQNYPNPFNPSTNIKFSIPSSGTVSLKVYDMLGKEVAELVNDELAAGNYTVEFNADAVNQNLASGVYFYRLESKYLSQTKKLMLIK